MVPGNEGEKERKKEKKNYAGSEEALPSLITDNEPLRYWVP